MSEGIQHTLGQEFRVTPHHPANTGVHQAVLVAGDIDGDDLLQSEVPDQVGVDEWSDEATGSRIHVDRAVDAPLDKQVVDGLGVLILAGVSRAQDGADPDRVLVDQVHRLLRVDDEAVLAAVHVLLLDIEVTRRLLPADLHGRVHDDVGPAVVFTLGLALVLPALLHGQRAEHDGFGGADGRGTHGVGVLVVGGDVEEARDHGHAAVLDVGRDGVLLVVDEVLGERVDHQFLRLLLHVGGDERSQAVARGSVDCPAVCVYSPTSAGFGKVTHLRVGVPSRVRSSLKRWSALAIAPSGQDTRGWDNALDHTVGNLLGHHVVGHDVFGQVGGGKARAIHAGRDLVLFWGSIQVEVADAWHELLLDRLVGRHDAQVNHVGGVGGCRWNGLREREMSLDVKTEYSVGGEGGCDGDGDGDGERKDEVEDEDEEGV